LPKCNIEWGERITNKALKGDTMLEHFSMFVKVIGYTTLTAIIVALFGYGIYLIGVDIRVKWNNFKNSR